MAILYYYTTAETMKYILTQGDIFATHINYLNDSEEYINGLRELSVVMNSQVGGGAELLTRSVYEEASKESPQIYSISFSKEADLLSQWYMYARESGVRLGLSFPRKKQKFEIKKKNSKKKELKREILSTLRDVRYFTRMGMPYSAYQKEETAIKKMIQEYEKEVGIQSDDDANAIRVWKEMAPYIKNYEFRQEKEVRLVFNAVVNGENSTNGKKGDLGDLIEYRHANGVLIPYIDVYRKEGWPVVEIMVGPGRNQDRVFRSICHFVDYNTLKIPKINQKANMKRFIEGLFYWQVEENSIETYCREIEENVTDGQGILTYKGQIYDVLRNKGEYERNYLDRNFYSNCGIIVRKSNIPYVFS